MLLERLERIESEDNFPDQVKDARAAIALSKSF